MPQQGATIFNVAQAYEVIKDMNHQGFEWSEHYRLHGRAALRLLIEGQMAARQNGARNISMMRAVSSEKMQRKPLINPTHRGL